MQNEAGNGPAGLEGKLGGRLTVWIGAIALALGGIFLVKFSIDQGLISPQLRVISGLVAGLGMALGAWRLRERSNYVAQGLAAAAVADVFACIWAAVNLYHMIEPPVGFVVMASTAAAAAIMSRGLGPIVAVVGLLGGFLTPLLLPGGDLPWLLFGYFLLLQGGTEVLARKPGQEWLSVLGIGAGVLWALAYVIFNHDAGATYWVAAFGVASMLLYANVRRADTDFRLVFGMAAGALAMGLCVLLLRRADYEPGAWLVLATAVTGIVASARLRDELAPLAWVAAAGAVVAAMHGCDRTPAALAPSLIAAFSFGAMTLLALRSGRAGHWLNAGGLGASVLLFVVWFQLQNTLQHSLERSFGLSEAVTHFTWPVLFVLLAAGLTGVSGLLLRRQRERAWVPLAYAHVPAFVAWPLEFDAPWFTVLWAMQLSLLMWQAHRLNSAALRGMGFGLAVVVFCAFGLNLGVPGYEVMRTPLLNWIAPAYISAIGGLVITRLLLPRSAEFQRGILAVGGCWLGLVGLLLEVRHVFGAGDMTTMPVTTGEVILHTCLTLLYAGALVRLAPRSVWGKVGEALLAVTAAFAVLGLGLAMCPWLTHERVGDLPLFNFLALQYLLPALVMAALIYLLRGRVPRELLGVMGAGVAALALAWVGLSIRHAFHGTKLWGGGSAAGEHLAYSLATAAGAVAMLVWGLRTQHRGWRIAGLAAIGVCTCKVFLFDAGNTAGIYRALSFLGLGASLMGLGYLYNRFVIRDFASKPLPPAAAVPAGEPVPLPLSTGESASGTPGHAV